MAAPATQLATLIHLETGHVLAAVTAVGAKPSVGDLIGDFLPVRIPGTDSVVNVPAARLTAASVAVIADVLDRPQSYQLSAGNPLRHLNVPAITTVGLSKTDQGERAVAVWQVGDESFSASGTVDVNGRLPGEDLSKDAPCQLVAVDGQALRLVPPVVG
jgi:hypothetical protein